MLLKNAKLQATDLSGLQRAHRFIWTEEDERKAAEAEAGEGGEGPVPSWEIRLAKKYYQRLFKARREANRIAVQIGSLALP